MKRIQVSKKEYTKKKSRKSKAGVIVNYGITDEGVAEIESIDFPDNWTDGDMKDYKKRYGLCLGANGDGYTVALGQIKVAEKTEQSDFMELDVVANTRNLLMGHGFKISENMKYDLSNTLLNAPVMLDHARSAAFILGTFEPIKTTEDGLLLRLKLKKPEDAKTPEVYDVLKNVELGLATAVSISGYFSFDDTGTLALSCEINEVSVVWRGSDPLAGAYLASENTETEIAANPDWSLADYLERKTKGAINEN